MRVSLRERWESDVGVQQFSFLISRVFPTWDVGSAQWVCVPLSFTVSRQGRHALTSRTSCRQTATALVACMSGRMVASRRPSRFERLCAAWSFTPSSPLPGYGIAHNAAFHAASPTSFSGLYARATGPARRAPTQAQVNGWPKPIRKRASAASTLISADIAAFPAMAASCPTACGLK